MHKLIGEWTSWFKPAPVPADVLPHGAGVVGGEAVSEAAGRIAKPQSQEEGQPARERREAGDRVSAGSPDRIGAGCSPGRAASDHLPHEQDGEPQPSALHPADSGQQTTEQATEEQPSDESQQHEESRPQHAAAGGEHCDASSDTDVSMGDGDWDVSLSQSPAAAAPAWRHGTGQAGNADGRAAQPRGAHAGAPHPSGARPSISQPIHVSPTRQVAEPAVSPPGTAKGTATVPEAPPAASAAADDGRDACEADIVPPRAAQRGGVSNAAQSALDSALDAMPTARATHPNFIILSSSSGEDTEGSDDEQHSAARPRPSASPPPQRLDANGADARQPASAVGGAAAAHAPKDPRLEPERSAGVVSPASTQQPRPPRVTPLTPPPMRSPARSDMRAQGWQPQQSYRQQHRQKQAEPFKAASGPEVKNTAVSMDKEAAHAAKRRRIDGGAADAWRAAHGTGPLWGSEAPQSTPSGTEAGDGAAGREPGAKPANAAQEKRKPTGSPVKVQGVKRPASAAAPASPAEAAVKSGAFHEATEQQPAKRTKASVAQGRKTASAAADPSEDVLIRPKDAQRQKQRALAGAGRAASDAVPGKWRQRTEARSGVGQRLPGLGTPLNFRASRTNAKACVAAAATASMQSGEQTQHQQQNKQPQTQSPSRAAGAKHRVPPGWVPVASSGADRPQDVSTYLKQRGDILQQMMRDAGREVRFVSRTHDAPDHDLHRGATSLQSRMVCSFAAAPDPDPAVAPCKSDLTRSDLRRATQQHADQQRSLGVQLLLPGLARTLLEWAQGTAQPLRSNARNSGRRGRRQSGKSPSPR